MYQIEGPSLLQSFGINCTNFGYQARVQYSLSSTDRRTDRESQSDFGDMLRACALDYGSSWDENLPYAEFSYNNSYQSRLKMAPFEALYGRRCRTPLSWDEVGDRQLFGLDLIKESKQKVKLIRDRTQGSSVQTEELCRF